MIPIALPIQPRTRLDSDKSGYRQKDCSRTYTAYWMDLIAFYLRILSAIYNLSRSQDSFVPFALCRSNNLLWSDVLVGEDGPK